MDSHATDGQPKDTGDCRMDSPETDDRESETAQHNKIEATNDAIKPDEDPREENESNICKIQSEERETEEVLLNDNNRDIQ